MSDAKKKGFSIDKEFFQNVTVIIGILFTLYQGSAFIANQVNAVEDLRTDVGRIQTHIAKIDDRLATLDTDAVIFRQTAESVIKIEKIIKDMERTVLELEIRSKG